MSEYRKKYLENLSQREDVGARIQTLLLDPKVKAYAEAMKEGERLYQESFPIYEAMRNEEFDNCQHLLVCTDNEDGLAHVKYGCIKCGLDNRILSKDRELLFFPDRVMYDYLRKHYLRGPDLGIRCDVKFGMAIYQKIKDAHPEMSEEELAYCFVSAIHNMRTKDVSEERQLARMKRLCLTEEYKK